VDEAQRDRKRAKDLDPTIKIEEEKARNMSIEIVNDYVTTQKSSVSTVPLTPPLEEADPLTPPLEEEDTEMVKLLSVPSNRKRSFDEISLKVLLARSRRTIVSTQKLNNDLESKMEALKEYYEKKDVARELTVQLLMRKCRTLNQSFKFVLSAFTMVTMVDFIIALSRSRVNFFRTIWNNGRRIIHLAMATTGMGLLLDSDNLSPPSPAVTLPVHSNLTYT